MYSRVLGICLLLAAACGTTPRGLGRFRKDGIEAKGPAPDVSEDPSIPEQLPTPDEPAIVPVIPRDPATAAERAAIQRALRRWEVRGVVVTMPIEPLFLDERRVAVVALFQTVSLRESEAILAADEARGEACENADEARWEAMDCDGLDWGTACGRPASAWIVAIALPEGRVTGAVEATTDLCPDPYNYVAVGEVPLDESWLQDSEVVHFDAQDVDQDGHLEILFTLASKTPNARAVGPGDVTTMAIVSLDVTRLVFRTEVSSSVGSTLAERTVSFADRNQDGRADLVMHVQESAVDCSEEQATAAGVGYHEMINRWSEVRLYRSASDDWEPEGEVTGMERCVAR